MRSTRFSSRARDRQRGFALVSALIIALLYLALIAVLWLESIEAYRSAMRFRARVLATTLAENGVEIAARGMFTLASSSARGETPDGTMEGSLESSEDGTFRLTGKGRSEGVFPMEAEVVVEGRTDGPRILIDTTEHTPGRPIGDGKTPGTIRF